MSSKFSTFLGVAAAALTIAAIPASANTLQSVTITGNCTSFTVTAVGAFLDDQRDVASGGPGLKAHFSFTVNTAGGSFVVTGDVPFARSDPGTFADDPGDVHHYGDTQSVTINWPQAVSGATSITGGTAVLTGVFSDENEPTIAMTDNLGTLSCGTTGTPGLKITKTANPTSISNPFTPVTFTYTVTNTGGVTLNNIVITDDNGTPGFAGDDTTTTIPSLGPGASTSVSRTGFAPLTKVGPLQNKTNAALGTLIVQEPTSGPFAGDLTVTYLQNAQFTNDNSYGTGSCPAWGTHGHKFQDLVGSDEATFNFYSTSSAKTPVLSFLFDYISAASSGIGGTYPSGFGTVGVAKGGDGKLVTGNAAWILPGSTTTLTQNLQLPQFQSGFTTNSPKCTSSAPLTPPSAVNGWNFQNGYFVVISPAAFGGSLANFASVDVPAVHDSPPISTEPKNTVFCNGSVTNIANAVAATAGGTSVTANPASATVTLTNQTLACPTP